MKKIIVLLVFMTIMGMSLSGCYINEEVKPSQMAVQLDSNRVVNVVGPGIYSDWGFFADLQQIDIGTITFSIDDPEVMTQDNQAVAVKMTIQAQRNNDKESMIGMITNWASLIDNNNMASTISATAREGMKNGVRSFTLNKLLDDRNGLSTAIREQLEKDTEKYSVKIINVTIENIGVNPDYMKILNDKALVRAETEKELQRQELIKQKANNDILQAQNDKVVLEQELLKQKAQTDIDVEIASREGKKIANQYDVYKNNPQAFQLELVRRWKDVFGDKTVYFLPEGVDLTTLFNMGGVQVVPTN